jgi:hypothetical protein
MPEFSTYTLREIDKFVQKFSPYAQNFSNPLLPASLVDFNCCLSHFPSYTLSEGFNTPYDPGFAKNIKAIELPGSASFTNCYLPPGVSGERPRCDGANASSDIDGRFQAFFTKGSALLVYPGCMVAVTVRGRVFYQITLGKLVYELVDGSRRITEREYYSDVQVSVVARENPPCYLSYFPTEDICPCCPMIGPDTPESDLTWISLDGLSWDATPFYLYTGDSPNISVQSPTAYSRACAQSIWDDVNPPPNPASPPTWLIYSDCIQYVPADTPFIAYSDNNTKKTLAYHLINRSFINRNYYCCEGQLGYDEYDEPYCEGNPPDPEDPNPCCDLPDCKCRYPVFEDPTAYYRDIDLVFYYTNKSNCIAQLDVSFNFANYYTDSWFWNYDGNGANCAGSNLKITAEVISGSVGC